MNAEVFVDTNVLLYAIDEDPASASKRQRAQQLLLSERWGWSVQVAGEFFVNATSAKRPFRLAAADAAAVRIRCAGPPGPGIACHQRLQPGVRVSAPLLCVRSAAASASAGPTASASIRTMIKPL